jgi:hypothetical protein
MPIAKKREFAALRVSQLPRARCPACGVGLLERDLEAHVRGRCAGSREQRDAELSAAAGRRDAELAALPPGGRAVLGPRSRGRACG